MKPVDQTIFEDGKGDCLRACVASILGIPILDVPNFAEFDYFTTLHHWLGIRGIRFVEVRFASSEHCRSAWYGYSHQPVLLWGDSPRNRPDGGRKQHAVVAKSKGYGFEMIHDPHPSRDGLISEYGAMWLFPPTGGVL